MGDTERFDEDIGDRLTELEQRFQLIDERLAKIEARVGIAPAKPAEPLRNTFEVSEAARPEVVQPILERAEHEAPPARIVGQVQVGPRVPTFEQVQGPAIPEMREYEPTRRAPERVSFGDLEARVTGRLLAWVGGLALIIGAIFFLSLAFSRGWIGPTARVTIGLVVGVTLVGAGAWFFERKDRLFGNVLTPVGLGVLSLSFYAGTRLYDLFPVELGLAGALVSAVAVAVVAIRVNSQLIAAFGLVTALSAPIVLGASASMSTIAFVAAALVGTTIVALYRTWNWLPALAFLLAAPQVIDYVTGDVSIAAGMTALAAFWLLNAIAAGGEEFRTRRGRLSVTSTTLLVADAAFTVGFGFYLLRGDAEWGRGLFLVALAAAYLVLGGYFLLDRGDHHPFGMLAFGTGIAAASMALPVQLGGPPVPIGWAAEAAALAWVYAYRRHGYSALMSFALGSMAIGHLVMFEYPFDRITEDLSSRIPFINANGGTLAFILAAIAVVILVTRKWHIGQPLAALGSVLVVYALPFETSGLLLVGLWSALFVVLVGVDQRAIAPRLEIPSPGKDIVRYTAVKPILLAGMISMFAAIGHLLMVELEGTDRSSLQSPGPPFWDHASAAAAMVIAAFVLVGFLARATRGRRWTTTCAFIIAAYVVPFELGPASSVVAWSVLAIASLALVRIDTAGYRRYGIFSGVLLALGSLVTLGEVATPDRLGVSATSTINHPIFWSAATASIGSIVVALIVAGIVFRSRRIARGIWLLAAAWAVYLVSIGAVDEFQSRLGGATSLEELQKQAQVTLSILWAVLGGVALVVGLWRQITLARGAGLALLAIVTAKVFVYDLSSLDAAYRVLSFIGLGVLLLVVAYFYQHIGPHHRTPAAT